MTTLLGDTPNSLCAAKVVQGLKWSIEVISENGDVVDIVEPRAGE